VTTGVPCCRHLQGCMGIAQPGEKCGLCRIADSQPTTAIGRLIKVIAKSLAEREAERDVEMGG
jgi:hypothetical protein